MARGWLKASLLPSEFWFYTVKQAVQATKYIPVTLRDQITTPFEVVHHVKPNIRDLFLMFIVAYVDKHEDSTTLLENVNYQSLCVIAIGKSSKSNYIDFSYPL